MDRYLIAYLASIIRLFSDFHLVVFVYHGFIFVYSSLQNMVIGYGDKREVKALGYTSVFACIFFNFSTKRDVKALGYTTAFPNSTGNGKVFVCLFVHLFDLSYYIIRL